MPGFDADDARLTRSDGRAAEGGHGFRFHAQLCPAPPSMAPVFAFAGIAKPDDFFAELERAGWRLAGRRAFGDHHLYSRSGARARFAQRREESGADVARDNSKRLSPDSRVAGYRSAGRAPEPDIAASSKFRSGFRSSRRFARGSRSGSREGAGGMRHQLEYLLVKSVELAVRPSAADHGPAAGRSGSAWCSIWSIASIAESRWPTSRWRFPSARRPSATRSRGRCSSTSDGCSWSCSSTRRCRASSKLALVDWEGEERVRLAYAQGKGILFCTGHFGFWEQQALAHALKFEPMAVMARPLDNPKLHDLLERIRMSNGNAVAVPARRRAKGSASAGRGQRRGDPDRPAHDEP